MMSKIQERRGKGEEGMVCKNSPMGLLYVEERQKSLVVMTTAGLRAQGPREKN
jgi:phosphosulfolactate phosphohydrolase-like enzyme